MSNEYNGWNLPLMVTLTATRNKNLADRLPLRGLLRIHEMRTDGYATGAKVTFLEVDSDGNPVGTEVAADDAEFSYFLPVARERAEGSTAEALKIARAEAFEARTALSSLRVENGAELLSPTEHKARQLAKQKRANEADSAYQSALAAHRTHTESA